MGRMGSIAVHPAESDIIRSNQNVGVIRLASPV
jgi:hypothetical protein